MVEGEEEVGRKKNMINEVTWKVDGTRVDTRLEENTARSGQHVRGLVGGGE